MADKFRDTPRYKYFDDLHGKWVELKPSQLYYTGFNQLNILLDTFSEPPINELVYLTMIQRYCERVTTCGIEINIYVPQYLNDKWISNSGVIRLKDEPTDQDFPPSKAGPKLKEKADLYPIKKINIQDFTGNPKNIFENINEMADRLNLFEEGGLRLFDLYNKLGCDYLVTNNRVLLKERNREKFIEDARIVTWTEICPLVEQFMIGNNLFIGTPAGLSSSLPAPIYGLNAGTHYAMVDTFFQRYQNLWGAMNKIANDPKMNNFMRVAIFHRYQFMLHARDKILYEIFQSKKAELLYDEKGAHHFVASYHLNMFYLMLWGCLDNLAWAFNYFYKLGFDDLNEKTRTGCSFGSKEYRKRLKRINMRLFKLIAEGAHAKWIVDLKIKRHPAAHREPIFLSTVIDSSGKNPFGDRVVVSDKDSKVVFYDAINHLKYDEEKFHNFMSSICELFNV